jgi:hypothetical protein
VIKTAKSPANDVALGTIYVVFRRKSDSFAWNGTIWESWNDSHFAIYQIVSVALGGNVYGVTVPSSFDSGDYDAFFYEQLTGTKLVTDPFTVESFHWTGTASSPISQDLTDPNNYFSTRLHSSLWFNSSTDDQTSTLTQADRIIDSFNYISKKSDPLQSNEWPRIICKVSQTPNEILYAKYEIAFALLSGIDPENELRSLRVTSRGYSSVRTTYSAADIPENIVNGVPSALAWLYLKPFFKTSGTIKIRRVS